MNSYGDGNTYRGTVCKDSETPTIITDGKTAYSGKDYPVHSSGPWEDIEDNKPYLCVPTLDGNAHVIPVEVFDKIVSGEMKITDMEDWEIIARTAFSEWLRWLETAAKARVYKAAIDQLAGSMAAGAWQDGPAPKDGSWILGLFHGLPYVVGYDSWEVGGDEESPPDGHESGWCLAGDNLQVMDKDEPEKWARIIHPDRHMPASWDGPGDRR